MVCCCCWSFHKSYPGRNYIRPPPPSPHFGQKACLRERGGGVYILRAPGAGFYTPSLFYTPPTPRRVFSGLGGWGCIKFGLVSRVQHFMPQATAHKKSLEPCKKKAASTPHSKRAEERERAELSTCPRGVGVLQNQIHEKNMFLVVVETFWALHLTPPTSPKEV